MLQDLAFLKSGFGEEWHLNFSPFWRIEAVFQHLLREKAACFWRNAFFEAILLCIFLFAGFNFYLYFGVDKILYFQQDCAAYKNTRHNNLVLFLGCCMDKDAPFIVLNLCKGVTLHVLLHEVYQKFDISQVIRFGIQICQVCFCVLFDSKTPKLSCLPVLFFAAV